MKIIFKTVELDIDLFENVIWLILKATLGRLMVTFGFRAVSEQFQSIFRTFLVQFQSNFRAISGYILAHTFNVVTVCSVGADLGQF